MDGGLAGRDEILFDEVADNCLANLILLVSHLFIFTSFFLFLFPFFPFVGLDVD